MKGAFDSPPYPAKQFPEDESAAAAKNEKRSGLPHQGVDDLAHLGIRHAEKRSSFAACPVILAGPKIETLERALSSEYLRKKKEIKPTKEPE
jgi:hypothetical protein